MKVRLKTDMTCEGIVLRLNTCSCSEVIIGFIDPDGNSDGADSMYYSDLEVQLPSNEWKCLVQALKDHDVITDNYYTQFFFPQNKIDRERGWR